MKSIPINYSLHVVHYICMTHLFYNWNFVHFDLLHEFHPPSTLLLATTNLFSVSMSSGGWDSFLFWVFFSVCLFLCLFFKILPVSKVTQYFSLYIHTYMHHLLYPFIHQCFHVLVIANNIAVNIGVYRLCFLWINT